MKMKKILTLTLALALVLSATAALADQTVIDVKTPRNIKINEAGLNLSADELFRKEGISPTTGRYLEDVQMEMPEGSVGIPYGHYTPVMVQISNSGGGVGASQRVAPIGIQYADVVYEECQATSQTRFSAVFSDIIPEYVGFVRSTRLTHLSLRQEWNSAYVTSGYSADWITPEIRRLGVKNPASKNLTLSDPGLIYVGDYPKVWDPYKRRGDWQSSPDNELFQLAKLMSNVYPKYYEMDPNSAEYKQYAPYNHTFLFTDELPASGDAATRIEVTFGGGTNTDSVLEYDRDSNTYLRYVPKKDGNYYPFRVQYLVNPHDVKKRDEDGKTVTKLDVDSTEPGEQLSFTNVIIQDVVREMKADGMPDHKLLGSGNADYFMGGKHYTGVWSREGDNSRTVFYGEDGNEIKLLRGNTLIILMDYDTNSNRSVCYEELAE